MVTAYYLSENDVAVVRRLVHAELNRVQSGSGRPRPDLDENPAPEVYVARAPAGGIAALTPAAGTGTGTAGDAHPGYADCDIFRVAREATTPYLEQITGLQKRVYNVGTSAVAASALIQVHRDKAGAWLAVPAGGGAAATRTYGRIDGVYDWQGTYLYSWTEMQRGTPWGWAVKPGGIVGIGSRAPSTGTGTLTGFDDSFQAAQEYNNNNSVSTGKVVEMIAGYNDVTGGRGQTYFFFYPKALVDISATMGCVGSTPTWTPIKTYD